MRRGPEEQTGGVSGAGGYALLLRTPGGPAASAAALVGRMPIAMLGIGFLLLVVDRSGSYALAGAVAASYSVGRAVLGPAAARLLTRRGTARGLVTVLVLHVAAVLALVGASGRLPGPVLLVAGLAAGGALPPLGACIRTRWGELLDARGRPEALGTALALEAVLDEIVFVLGPLLVVACATALDPAVGVAAALVLTALGTLGFAALPGPDAPPAPPDARTSSALRLPGIPVLVLSLVGLGSVFGALEVSTVAFATEQGAPDRAGLLLALVAGGSGVAGLAYGARSWHAPVDRRYAVALGGLAVAVVPLLLAPGLAGMAGAGLLAGLAISPSLIAASGLVDELVPAGARTEGFTLLTSGLLLGIGAGTALGGVVAERAGSRWGFALCLAGAVAACAVAVAGQQHWRGATSR